MLGATNIFSRGTVTEILAGVGTIYTMDTLTIYTVKVHECVCVLRT